MMRKTRYLWLEAPIYFLYYFCVSPFKFQYNHETHSYKLITNGFHKVLPIAVHIFGILQTLISMYTSTTQASLDNPRCIFHIGVTYSRYVIYYALIFTFWTRKSHFVAFFCSQTSTPPASPKSTFFVSPKNKKISTQEKSTENSRTKYAAWTLCMLMIPVAIGIEVLNYSGSPTFYEYVEHTFRTRGDLRKVENIFGRDNMSSWLTSPEHLPPHANGHPPPPPPPNLTSLQFIITVLYDSVVIYVRVCNHIAVLFCILAGVTLHEVATQFVASVAEERDQDKVILKYTDFCKFGSCLNKMCGCVVLGSVICSPPFYIVYLIGVFSNVEVTGPRVMFYSCMYCILFIVAAEGASKISEFKEWIVEYGEGGNESQLFTIFVEVSENPIGLRGMGWFTITYGFLSKVFSCIITFTILLLQFETTPETAMTRSKCQ